MNKEIVCSLQEEPVTLLQTQEFLKLINYAKENQQKLDSLWLDGNTENIQLFLKYATSKLSYLESYLETEINYYSILRLGALLGAVESYEKILYDRQQENLAVNKIYEDGHTIKYLDDIVRLLENHGGLTHAELCKYLSLKISTLSEAIKKVKDAGVISTRTSGKYKIYSLTDVGIRYGKYIRNKSKNNISSNDILQLLQHYVDASTPSVELDVFRDSVLKIFELGATINKNQEIMLHIQSPRLIERRNVQVMEVERNDDEKTHLYCKWDGLRTNNENIATSLDNRNKKKTLLHA